MSKEKDQYDGEYKIIVSDKGTVNFSLNWKWLIGILVPIIGFVGYIIIDEYYIEPNEEKNKKILVLEEKASITSEILKRLEKNQIILLDRSERNEKIIAKWINDHGGIQVNTDNISISNQDGPGSNSN